MHSLYFRIPPVAALHRGYSKQGIRAAVIRPHCQSIGMWRIKRHPECSLPHIVQAEHFECPEIDPGNSDKWIVVPLLRYLVFAKEKIIGECEIVPIGGKA